MSSTATFKPATRRGQQSQAAGGNIGSGVKAKHQANQNNQSGSSTNANLAQGGSSGIHHQLMMQSPNIRKTEVHLSKEINTVLAHSRPSIIIQQQTTQSLMHEPSSKEILSQIVSESTSQTRIRTVGKEASTGKKAHAQKNLSLMAPVTPTNHNNINSLNLMAPINLNDYYSVQSQSNNNSSSYNNTTSRNVVGTVSHTGIKKSSMIGNASNRKSSNVSGSRNTFNAGAVTNYTLIKSNNVPAIHHHQAQRPGISGRMQKQFHQYHGQGGGSPPLKGTQRTSMMNVGGGTIKNKESSQIMTLIPVKNNIEIYKRPTDKRNSQASVSLERSRQKVNTAINTKHLGDSQIRNNDIGSRQVVIQNLTQNQVQRTSSIGMKVQQITNNVSVRNPLLKQDVLHYYDDPERISDSSNDQDLPSMDHSNIIKEYQSKSAKPQHIPPSSPRTIAQYSPRNSQLLKNIGSGIIPSYTPINNYNNGTSQNSFFKSPSNPQKKQNYQAAKTTNNGGSPIPSMNRNPNNGQTQVKTVLSSRLSTGPGGGNTNGIKKNLSMNGNESTSKSRANNNFSKSNLNLNTQLLQILPSTSNAANLLQIDLSQLSAKNGPIHHLQQPSHHQRPLENDDQPFELYGSQIPISLSIPEQQSDQVLSNSPLKKRDSLLIGPSLTHKQSISQLTSNAQQVSAFQNQQPPTTVLFGKSPKAQSRPTNNVLTTTTFTSNTNRHSIITKTNKQPQTLIKKKTQPQHQLSDPQQSSYSHLSNQQATKSKTQRVAKVVSKVTVRTATVKASEPMTPEIKVIELPEDDLALRASSLQVTEKSELPEVESTGQQLPMSRAQFREKYQVEPEGESEIIYFVGPLELEQIVERKEIQDGQDDEEGYYKVRDGEQLMYRYEVLRVLGKGSFAQVVCCKDHKLSTRENDFIVAVKITRNTELDHKFAMSEANLLKFIMEKDPNDEHNIVRLLDEFQFRGHHCFVFELLECGDLFEHLKATGFSGFPVATIKQYAKEILQALVFLEKLQIIHCDLKPENILLVQDSSTQKNKLKLVDFGSGSFRGEQAYTYVQSRFYRAPEVIMRLLPPPTSYTEKVDMWSLGCILAELYTGEPLFPGNNEQEQLELIMEIFGIPPASLIDRTRKKDHYFDTDYSPFLIEDEEQGILRIPDSKRLEQVIQTDDFAFVDFIKQCLVLNPDERFSASDALNHPWVCENRSPQILQSKIIHKRTSSDFSQKPETSELEGLQRPMGSSISSTHQAFLAATSSMRKREADSSIPIDMSPIVLQNHYNTNFSKISAPPFEAATQGAQLFTLVDLRDDDHSQTSSPKNEGGIQSNKYSSLSKSPHNNGGAEPQSHKRKFYNEELKYDDMDITAADMLQTDLKITSSAAKSPNWKKGSLNSSIEKRRDREARKAAAQAANQLIKTPLKGSLIVTQSPMPKGYETQMQGQAVQIIGQYEIFRDEEGKDNSLSRHNFSPLAVQSFNQNTKTNFVQSNPSIRESVQSITSGIASEANIPPLQQQNTINEGIVSQEFMINQTTNMQAAHLRLGPNSSQQKNPNMGLRKQSNQTDGQYSTQSNAPPVTTENSINKITITFYQKRNQQNTVSRGTATAGVNRK